MFRNSDKCKKFKLNYTNDNINNTVSYDQWVKEKITRVGPKAVE